MIGNVRRPQRDADLGASHCRRQFRHQFLPRIQGRAEACVAIQPLQSFLRPGRMRQLMQQRPVKILRTDLTW